MKNSHIIDTYAETFGGVPAWRIRAPGRVNLIGDHTDYNGLPVLPMAIQRHITMTGRPRADDLVRVVNVDRNYDRIEFRLVADMSRGPSGSWENYVKAGPRALMKEHGASLGFDAVVTGNIPIASGLSSSSALVVASGLAACEANSIRLDIPSMAELMARAERFVGTQGGGMDQAVCLGGQAGAAVRIDFAPLRLRAVSIPKNWTFLVAHCLQRAEKSGDVQRDYNERTEDCRSGFARVARALNPTTAPLHDYPTMLASFGEDTILGVASRVLDGRLCKRFRHTVSEAARVNKAEQAMRADDRARFGALMLDSHMSLRDDYEVSLPVLDELVTLMTDAGCEGARLTGAGFGGCAVGLCASDIAGRVRDSLVSTFYRPRGVTSDLDDHVFVAEPSAGATVGDVS